MINLKIGDGLLRIYCRETQIQNNLVHELERSDVLYIFNPENFTFDIKLNSYNMSVIVKAIEYNWSLLGGVPLDKER